MRDIIQKPSFRRAYKKLHLTEKNLIDKAIREIMADPKIGELKKGDLAGVCVHKFKVNQQEKLLAYEYDHEKLLLLDIGSHENFYRDLKKSR